MARQLRFNGTGSGVNGCPSVHEDLDTGDIIVHGPVLTDPDDVAQLRHLGEGEVPIVVPREVLVDFGPKEVNRVPDIIGLDEFDQLFTRFEHTAWRLETRRRYASDETTDTYAQFTRGEPVNWDGVDAAWCAERRDQTALGKRFERVRIIDTPPTTGQLYLLDNARRNSAVGEIILSLPARMLRGWACRRKTSGSLTPGWSPCSTSTTPTTSSTSSSSASLPLCCGTRWPATPRCTTPSRTTSTRRG